LLDWNADKVRRLTHFRFREEASVVKPKQELTDCYLQGGAGGVKFLGWHAVRSIWGLGPKLAGAPTHWAELTDRRLVLSHPGNPRIAKSLEPSLVPVERVQRGCGLCKPERQVCVVTGELVEMLRRKAANLGCDQFGSGDRVRGSLLFHFPVAVQPILLGCGGGR
jgi:hypothetical protein